MDWYGLPTYGRNMESILGWWQSCASCRWIINTVHYFRLTRRKAGGRAQTNVAWAGGVFGGNRHRRHDILVQSARNGTSAQARECASTHRVAAAGSDKRRNVQGSAFHSQLSVRKVVKVYRNIQSLNVELSALFCICFHSSFALCRYFPRPIQRLICLLV